MTANITRIDNADARVVYEGAWLPEYNDSNAWNKTLTLTRGVNNSASISFTGNSIAVYGVLSKTAPHTTKYSLDDLSPTTFAPAQSVGNGSKSVLFYQSPPLPYGRHALTVTNTKELNSIWLDYFEVATLDAGNSAAAPPRTLSPSRANPPKARGTSTGVIVGASIAGLIVALLLVGLIILVVRRRQKHAEEPVLPQHLKIRPKYLTRVDTGLSDVSSLASTTHGK